MLTEFLKNMAVIQKQEEEEKALKPVVTFPDDPLHKGKTPEEKYYPVKPLSQVEPVNQLPSTPTVAPQTTVEDNKNNIVIDRTALDASRQRLDSWMNKSAKDLDGDVEKNPDGTPKKDKWYENMAKGVGLTLAGLAPIMNDPNISDGDALKLTLGRMLGGAVGSLINPLYDEEVRLQSERNKAKQQYAEQQGIFSQNLENLQAEANIQDTYSKMQGREADLIRKNNELLIKAGQAEDKLRVIEGGTILKQWKDSPTFDPDSNPNDRAVSEKYRQLMGVPLVKKSAKVKDVEYIPDAETNQMFVKMVDEQGKTIESGWLMDNGGVTTDRTKAGQFKTAIVKSGQIGATSREKVAQINTTSRREIEIAKLKENIRQFNYKSEDEVRVRLDNVEKAGKLLGMTDEEIEEERVFLTQRLAEVKARNAETPK